MFVKSQPAGVIALIAETWSRLADPSMTGVSPRGAYVRIGLGSM
jgi:hypothetical protein